MKYEILRKSSMSKEPHWSQCKEYTQPSNLGTPPHPRLQETYTGHWKTHGQNNFFWPFLTKTKQEWPLTGHFQGKFLLGALHFGCQTLEPKMVGFVGSACAQATPMEKVWTAMFTKTKVNQFRNKWKLVSGLKFDNFFRISPKKCTKMKKRTFFWEGYWKRSCALNR